MCLKQTHTHKNIIVKIILFCLVHKHIKQNTLKYYPIYWSSKCSKVQKVILYCFMLSSILLLIIYYFTNQIQPILESVGVTLIKNNGENILRSFGDV